MKGKRKEMSRGPRAPIDPKTEAGVLTKSRRRCCLCVGLYGDMGQKEGQIAHADRNRTNNKPDNLAFLCLPHHNEYDTRTSQSKGMTEQELKYYRKQLFKVVKLGFSAANVPASVADRERYQKVVARFKAFIHWIERHTWQSQFHIKLLDPMIECLDEGRPPDEEFQNPELKVRYVAFYEALEDFNHSLATHSDANGLMQTTRPYTARDRARYPVTLRTLEKKADTAAKAYRNFIEGAKARFDV